MRPSTAFGQSGDKDSPLSGASHRRLLAAVGGVPLGGDAVAAEAPRTVDLPGSRVAYRESGSGSPLLFIHGWPLSSLTWRKVIPALEPSHRCIAVDLLGAGDTQAALDFDFSIPAQARMLAAFLDALDLPVVTLVAHDSGATIGRQLAVEHPERVSRFVMFDTEVPHHVPRMVAFLQMAARLPGSDRIFRAFVNSRRYLHSRLGFGNVASDLSALDLDELLEVVVEPQLGPRNSLRSSLKFLVEFENTALNCLPHERLTMRKLVLWGDHDTFFPLAWGRELFALLPEPKSFCTIADCGLLPHEEPPSEWLAAVRPF